MHYTISIIFSEEFRPQTIRPWSSIKTGKEGDFDDRVTSREHYVSRPCSSRVLPETKKVSLQTAPPEERLADTTTYKNYTGSQEVCNSPRKRAPRYNREHRLPDQLDWM